MTDQPDSATLARYLTGECSREEEEAVRRWVDADPARGDLLRALRQVWRQGLENRATLDVDALWSRVASQMDTPGPRQPLQLVAPTHAPTRTRRFTLIRNWRWLGGIAAAGLVLAVLIPRFRTALERSSSMDVNPHELREVVTKRGERVQVYLADGTHVTLDADSRLRFATDFGGRERDVDLQGRAFFDVTHDPLKPFRVRTATSVTEDLGTAFVVRAYPSDSNVQVAVASGRVVLIAARVRNEIAGEPAPPVDSLVLDKGDVGHLVAGGHVGLLHDAPLDAYLAWTTGELRFQRTPLSAVVRDLSRWYDVDIRLGDSSLAGRTLTARFKDQPAAAVLASVANVLDLRLTTSGTATVLWSKASRRPVTR